MASGNKARQAEQDRLQSQALADRAKSDTAISTASQPDPLEQRRRDYVTKILDWKEGTNGPPDVRAFPDQSAISLYNDAKTSHDAGRAGKGYGTLADGT